MVINTTLGTGFTSADRCAQARTEVAIHRNTNRRRVAMDKEDYTPTYDRHCSIDAATMLVSMAVKLSHLPLLLCFLAILFLAILGTNGFAQTKAQQPDVFLVTIDTLRAGHVHSYGYTNIETTALDGLAKDGIRFTQAFTPSPITNTSHTSILTGLLPSSHGVTDFAVPLSA